ncbi:MAG TPA: chemotaxis protein CheB [Terriglobales bacterium]|nr:chemotaxis protein CheB [Terriglobales bacterium]
MAERNIIVIGCSVGGVEALQEIVRGLPKNFPATVFVAMHLAPQSTSVLPKILERAGPLPAHHPSDGEPIRTGHIYVAPPDQHLLIERDRIHLTSGPKENRHRPAIDPLFRTAARWYGARVIGVILTGSLDDGTAGLLAVKKRGGIAIVEDPDSAFCGDMPRNAMETAHADYVEPLDRIPELLAELVPQPVIGNGAPKGSQIDKESKFAEADMSAVEDENRPGTPSQFACPECGGVLWEMNEEKMLRFRCRVGHAYTANNLHVEQTEAVESALWAAMRALEEGASLAKRMAENAEKNRHVGLASRFREREKNKMEQAEILRNVILQAIEPPVEQPTGA